MERNWSYVVQSLLFQVRCQEAEGIPCWKSWRSRLPMWCSNTVSLGGQAYCILRFSIRDHPLTDASFILYSSLYQYKGSILVLYLLTLLLYRLVQNLNGEEGCSLLDFLKGSSMLSKVSTHSGMGGKEQCRLNVA